MNTDHKLLSTRCETPGLELIGERLEGQGETSAPATPSGITTSLPCWVTIIPHSLFRNSWGTSACRGPATSEGSWKNQHFVGELHSGKTSAERKSLESCLCCRSMPKCAFPILMFSSTIRLTTSGCKIHHGTKLLFLPSGIQYSPNQAQRQSQVAKHEQ